MASIKDNSLKYTFYSLLLLTFLIKCYLAYLVPITGDEAEYVYWGQHLAWGYYDHPPLIAWLLHFVNLISLNQIWLRGLQIIVSTLIAFIIVKVFQRYDQAKAYAIATLFLLSPISLFDIGILTDTPLMLLSFLSIICLFLGQENKRYLYYILSGLLMGAAYFSKYLMFPLAISVLFYFIFSTSIQERWKKFIIFIIFTLPFFIQNIFWNYHHDWVNMLFNLDLRNAHSQIEFRKPLLYILCIIYIYSPIVIYFTFKKIKALYRLKINSTFSLFILTGIIPILFFAILSIVKVIGLHWIFSAYPFLFMALFPILNFATIKRCIYFMTIYSGLQLMLIIIVFTLPLSLWKQTRYFNKVNWFLNFQQVVPQISPYIQQGFILATPSYSQSYLLAYKQKYETVMWGVGSVHGRQDDLSSDFKKLPNKNFIIVDINNKLKESDVAPYFNQYFFKTFYLNDMPFHVILGYQFNYEKYRETILRRIYQKFYQVPIFLPRSSQYFKTKYGF